MVVRTCAFKESGLDSTALGRLHPISLTLALGVVTVYSYCVAVRMNRNMDAAENIGHTVIVKIITFTCVEL